MWPEEIGEEIYYDILESAGLSIDKHIYTGLITVVDIDQYYSGVDEDVTDQLKYVAVGNTDWSVITVNWTPAVGTGSAGAVRADCTPTFPAIVNQGSFETGGDYYTCVVKCRDGEFAIAGDSAGNVHILNLTTGADTLNIVPDAVVIQRVFEGAENTIFAWDQGGFVHWFTINKATGVISAITTYDVTAIEDFDTLIDVCKSFDGTKYMFTVNVAATSEVYYTDQERITAGIPVAPTLYVANMVTQVQNNVSTGITTQPMAFIDNSRVVVFSNTYTDYPAATVSMGDIYLIDLNAAAPNGTQLNANVPLSSFDAVGFTNNGDYGILTGRIQNGVLQIAPLTYNTMQQESVVIWKVVITGVGENASINLTPLYRERSDRQVEPVYRKFRMRKRHNSEQWILVFNKISDDTEDKRLMAIGEVTESPSPVEDSVTSTSITLKWSKPEEYYSEENIAFVRVMRSETCEPDDWECVYASDDLPCEYVDIQHPSVDPRDIDPTGGTNFIEVGLIDQVAAGDGGGGEIHPYDPSQDIFPNGRKFYYKVQWVSYVGLVSESSIITGTTAKPIQPVQVDVSIPMYSEYDWTEPYENLVINAESFTLNWDWTDLFGSIDASQFDRWEIGFFEAHQEGPFITEEIEPRLAATFAFEFPWIYTAGSDTWMCDRGAVVKNMNTKIATVEKLQNYDTGVLYEWPIIPYTVYRNSVIGWDKGGLWRAAAIVTKGEYDWNIARQVVPVHTLPKPSGVIEIEDTERARVYDADTPEFSYKDWIAYEEGAELGWVAVGNVGGNINIRAATFTSTQEHNVIGYRIWVHDIIGAPSDLRIEIVQDNAGMPGIANPTSIIDIPAADVQIGLNTVYFVVPADFEFYARTYHVYVSTSLGGGEGAGNSYRIGTSRYYGDTTRNLKSNVGFGWVADAETDLRVGMICSGYASDSIVLDSGLVSTFHTNKSTDASMQNLLYSDDFVNDIGNWPDFYGPVSPVIALGYMQWTLGPGQYSYTRLDLDNIGTETRNYIVMFDVYMVANQQSFEILLRTQTEYIATDFTAMRLHRNGVTNVWTLFQHHHSQVAGSTIATGTEFVLNVNNWHTIIIAVIDGSIMLFMDNDAAGVTALTNYQNGLSNLKGRIIDTVNYPFIDHGYPFIFGAIDASDVIRMNNFRIYGLPNSSDYGGGQGFFINYGDKSESGYFSLESIDKTYQIEPDDRMENFSAITHPINEFDQEDFGMPEINLTLHPSMTVDVKTINSVPVADIVCPDVAYVDKTIYADLSGSIDPDGGALVYHIDWDDGTTESGTTPQFTHTYTTIGEYTIDVYVTDELAQNSATAHHDISIESILNDLYELVPNFGFDSVTPSRANGSSVFNLPDQCGGETHATRGGSKKYDISGFHLDPCCCNNLITEWTIVETFNEIASWIESDGPNGGQAMEFEADNSLFAYATQMKIRINMTRTALFDGDIEVRLVDSLNPISEMFTRGTTQIIENADIPEHDGANHYFDLEFSGCPIDADGKTLYLVITPVNATAGAFRLRRANEGTGYRKLNGSNTWASATTSNIYMRVSVYNDPFDMAICEHLLFDDLHCEGQPFKMHIPGFGDKALIMTQYSSTKDSGAYKWMKYSMTVVEQSTEALTGV